MQNKNKCGILVLIPHSSTKRPKEIKKNLLHPNHKKMLFGDSAETDRGTEKLYNLKQIINVNQIVFKIGQIYVNVLRHPNKLEESIPTHIRGKPIYKIGKEIDLKLRKKLIKKYHSDFYNHIKKLKPKLIFNGHSTITGHSSLKNEKLIWDIFLVKSTTEYLGKYKPLEEKITNFYIDELKKRLPNLKICVSNLYVNNYDHIFSITKRKVPVITQETNENLYIKNNKINLKKVKILRKAFAESLLETAKHFKLM